MDLPSMEEWAHWVWESLNQFFVDLWDLWDWIVSKIQE
jgi:hypothetical protein